jgi:hypothetical protein
MSAFYHTSRVLRVAEDSERRSLMMFAKEAAS